MIRPPAFIRRWFELKANKRGRIIPIGREDELVNEHNRAQRDRRARPDRGGRDA